MQIRLFKQNQYAKAANRISTTSTRFDVRGGLSMIFLRVHVFHFLKFFLVFTHDANHRLARGRIVFPSSIYHVFADRMDIPRVHHEFFSVVCMNYSKIILRVKTFH